MKYVESITVYPSNKTIQLGKWYQKASASVYPGDADKPNVCWYSSNANVASVNPTTGYIYGVSFGTARIYAQACDGSGVSGYMTVTVAETVPVESITLNYSSLSIEKNTNVSLTASIYPEDATDKSLTWCSTNESVARVVNGVVCGIGRGTATITAESTDGKSASCSVTVTDGILVSEIVVIPSNITMIEGDSAFLVPSVRPGNATQRSVYWHSNNTAVATVNENSGLVCAQSAGTAIIYATARDDSGVTGCCRVTVNAPVMAESIEVSPEAVTVNVRESVELRATVYPTNTTDKRIRWSSSDTNVATVDSSTGVVTARHKGSTTIIAKAIDGSEVFGSCRVTAVTVPVTGISMDPTSYSMDVGDSVRFSATVTPSNATYDCVTWLSSDHSIATVSSKGCVTAKSAGNVIITAESVDNGMTASCYLTVNAVDTREKVTIEKDDEGGYQFFKVQFPDNKIWYSVGIDISVISEISYQSHLRRGNANVSTTFSNKQLAFLYLLDPLGVEYYVERFCAGQGKSTKEILEYKDNVYWSIFGIEDLHTDHFYFVVENDNVIYVNSYLDREDVYSNAEVVFGSHLIPNFGYIKQKILQKIFSYIPGYTYVEKGFEFFKAIFYAGSVVGGVSKMASDYIDDYIKNAPGKFLAEIFNWPNDVLTELLDIIEETFTPTNIKNIDIYKKVQSQEYQVVFKDSNTQAYINQVVLNCENN